MHMLRRRAEDPPEEESPEILLIIGAESGLSVFSQMFQTDHPLEEHLIAGFLTALNAFGRDAFAASTIERIKYVDYTLILQAVEPFLVSYVFQGPSYFAIQKLTQFTETLQTSEAAWQTLIDALYGGRVPRGVVIEDLEGLVTEIFQTPGEEPI